MFEVRDWGLEGVGQESRRVELPVAFGGDLAGRSVEVLRASSPFAKGTPGKSDALRMPRGAAVDYRLRFAKKRPPLFELPSFLGASRVNGRRPLQRLSGLWLLGRLLGLASCGGRVCCRS
jgi:hypothetical protein